MHLFFMKTTRLQTWNLGYQTSSYLSRVLGTVSGYRVYESGHDFILAVDSSTFDHIWGIAMECNVDYDVTRGDFFSLFFGLAVDCSLFGMFILLFFTKYFVGRRIRERWLLFALAMHSWILMRITISLLVISSSRQM